MTNRTAKRKTYQRPQACKHASQRQANPQYCKACPHRIVTAAKKKKRAVSHDDNFGRMIVQFFLACAFLLLVWKMAGG